MHASRPIDYFVDPSRRPSSDALFDVTSFLLGCPSVLMMCQDASADLQTTLDSADYAILNPYLEDSEDKPDLAEMARLVDDLATRYPTLPYIVVRAADMRLQLGSPATAMELYKTVRLLLPAAMAVEELNDQWYLLPLPVIRWPRSRCSGI